MSRTRANTTRSTQTTTPAISHAQPDPRSPRALPTLFPRSLGRLLAAAGAPGADAYASNGSKLRCAHEAAKGSTVCEPRLAAVRDKLEV